MRLLLVDDDLEFAESLRTILGDRDIAVEIARDVTDATQLLSTTLFAAVVLDLGSRDEDGSKLVRRWRTAGHSIPILVVSGRDDAVKRVSALRAGADDYLIKPFIIDELHARIDAIVRRRDGFPDPSIQAGALAFDTLSRQSMVHKSTFLHAKRISRKS
ncbi:response regulator [Sphingomonas sp. 66-10]|jgi:DNA-binding response OmpR family regulator|uniref:response regulator n=1 Tax=Sphingomonas sp. 66-10 TaxID=1895848 RepID=UPI000B16F3BA|nr:response regulator [Sphingomonas sp. 66-10]